MRWLGITALVAAAGLSGCAGGRAPRTELVRSPLRCADQTVQVYFEPWSAELTHEGRQLIDAAAVNVRGCKLAAVEVLGLADAEGAPGPNLELSKRRAQAVSQALAGAGLPPAEFHVAAAGQAGAVTDAGAAAPLRRRVDVTLRIAHR